MVEYVDCPTRVDEVTGETIIQFGRGRCTVSYPGVIEPCDLRDLATSELLEVRESCIAGLGDDRSFFAENCATSIDDIDAELRDRERRYGKR